MRFTDERIREELVPLVMDAANTLSTRLGYNQ
jgi:DNA-binding IclR family transcriptional regulator